MSVKLTANRTMDNNLQLDMLPSLSLLGPLQWGDSQNNFRNAS